jgi:hypothetical protein
MPCAVVPELRNGAVETPQYLVGDRRVSELPIGYATSPFRGVFDLYLIERVSIADSGTAAESSLLLFEVRQRIGGGAVAPPDVSPA